MTHGVGALVERAGALSIMAATPASLAAEDSGGAALADHLGLETPTDWPPEHNNAETRAWLRKLIAANPDHPGCGTWYIVVDGRPVGICSYKGPPNDAGEVEIGYSVLEHEQRRGYAAAAAGLSSFTCFLRDKSSVTNTSTASPRCSSP